MLYGNLTSVHASLITTMDAVGQWCVLLGLQCKVLVQVLPDVRLCSVHATLVPFKTAEHLQ